ncbi:MAG TPA: hypothetical protein VIX42_11835 [Edaphobacter sp.]
MSLIICRKTLPQTILLNNSPKQEDRKQYEEGKVCTVMIRRMGGQQQEQKANGRNKKDRKLEPSLLTAIAHQTMVYPAGCRVPHTWQFYRHVWVSFQSQIRPKTNKSNRAAQHLHHSGEWPTPAKLSSPSAAPSMLDCACSGRRKEVSLATPASTHTRSVLGGRRRRTMTSRGQFTLLAAALLSIAASAEQCKQKQFLRTISSQESYLQSFGPQNMTFRLTPLKNNWGWIVSIGPGESHEDWTYPLTFPLRTGESQLMGTGYGRTVQERLTGPTIAKFVLTPDDFLQYSKLADDALNSPRSEAAGEYIQKVTGLSNGYVIVEVLSYGKGDTTETVKWMKFKASIVVPMSFKGAGGPWVPVSCPSSLP